MTSNQI